MDVTQHTQADKWTETHPNGALSYRDELLSHLEVYYPSIHFDHIEVGWPGMRTMLCIFVTKGKQSCVLYDKTRGFPSAKLMASLVLLGSP